MDPLKTGKVIMNARKRLNMTQKDLADKLFISDKAVSKWERGLSFPDISVLIPLSEILNVNLNDLLKGEEMKEKQDDTILKETIKYSNNMNKKLKRVLGIIIVIMSIITIILLGALIIAKLPKTSDIKPGDKFTSQKREDGLIVYPYKRVVKEKDDGWICIMTITYADNNVYDYDCINLKYRELKGFNQYILNENTNQYYLTDSSYPSYNNNLKYRDDIYEIHNYFYGKKIDKPIKESDIKDLKLNYIDKKEFIEIFNETVNSKLIDSYGNYISLVDQVLRTEYKSDSNGKTYIVGYYFDWPAGYIRYVNIDIIQNGKYLSDEKLQRIEKYVLENQKFIIPDDLKDDPDAKELMKYNFYTIDGVINGDFGYSNGIIRYVTDPMEMEDQLKRTD